MKSYNSKYPVTLIDLNEMIQAVAVKAIAFLTLKPPRCISQRALLCSMAYQQVN